MFKRLKKWLGMCDHEWHHTSNIMLDSGPHEVHMCSKCFKLKFIHWNKK